jgi:hypothetical protein
MAGGVVPVSGLGEGWAPGSPCLRGLAGKGMAELKVGRTLPGRVDGARAR